MNKYIAIIPLLLLSVSAAWTQDDYDYSLYSSKYAAFGTLGTSTLYNYENAPFLYGGGMLYRPHPYLGFEFAIRHLGHEDSYSSYYFAAHSRSSTNAFTVSMQYYISDTRVQPYLLFGGGYVYEANESFSHYDSIRIEDHWKDSHSGFLVEVGGGLDLFLTKHLSLRPDARVGLGTFGAVQGALNVGYHW